MARDTPWRARHLSRSTGCGRACLAAVDGGWRDRWRVDWSLRGCARHGHATYAPDEPDLRARLRADTAAGEAWRCLRCASFVVGPPRGSGPADGAPIVLRDRALRDAVVLRLFAVERW